MVDMKTISVRMRATMRGVDVDDVEDKIRIALAGLRLFGLDVRCEVQDHIKQERNDGII